jgi:uncharacterized OsmC-like protein
MEEQAGPRGRLDIDRIKRAHDERREELAGSAPPLTVRAIVRVVEDQLKEARVGQFTFQSDETAHLGGRGKAPTPLAYFVASVGFCLLTQYTRAAAIHGVPVDDLQIEVRASFPVEWKYGLGEASSACDRLSYTLDVASPAPPESLVELLAWAERACHVVSTFREPVPVEVTLRHNGKAIRSE